jgi:hypothetical protein
LTLELLLLLLKLSEVGGKLLLLSSSSLRLRGRLSRGSLYFLLGNFGLCRLGLGGSATLLLGGGLTNSC